MNSPELEIANEEFVREITIFPANLCFDCANVEMCWLSQVLLLSTVHPVEF